MNSQKKIVKAYGYTKGMYKIQFEIENKMPTTKINWLLKDGLIFLYSYQVLIRVKVVICLWADTISHYHALAKDIIYYKWYVRPVFFETATYIENIITKNKKRPMGFIWKNSASSHNSEVKSLTSETTPSATHFFKRAYKISHPPRL